MAAAKAPERLTTCVHHRVVLAASLVPLLLNLRDYWVLHEQQRFAASLAPTPPPSGVRAATASAGPSATWFRRPNNGAPRVARVSAHRAQDAPLMRELGLRLETPLHAPQTSTHTHLHPADALLLEWEPPDGTPRWNRTTGSLDGVDVLWGQWTSSLLFFDARLHAHLMVNSLLGLEHDTLGTPVALARSYQRCVARWSRRACNFSSTPLLMHSHRDVGQLESVFFGEDELADTFAWQDIGAHGASSVWIAKQGAYRRSLAHQPISLFDGRQLLTPDDALPPGVWVVQPWPTSPLLWRHHRFTLRTWAVVGAANPLRVYLLQDGWAHIVAKPYRVDQLLTNYRDRCAHLWSTSACSVTHAHRVLRANHDDFATGLVGVPRGAERADYWRRVVWPALEDGAARLLASVWRELAGYEEMLVGSGRTYRRVAQLSLEWIIDDGGKPLLLDVDTAGALASDELPLSKAYATDALGLVGVGGYERSQYQKAFLRRLDAFCAAHACTQREADALQDVVDEAHHAGAFARVFPSADHARGCGAHCLFFDAPPTTVDAAAAVAPPLGADFDGWPPAAGRLNLLTWRFLHDHAAKMPARARPSHSK